MTDMKTIKITNEVLESVNGGYIHTDSDSRCYEIIDDTTGEVLACGQKNLHQARRKARKLGQSTYVISDEFLEDLREEKLQHNIA